MLENPEFAGHFDYTPSQQYDTKGDRVYEHFMLSDWAWKQAVCDVRRAHGSGLVLVTFLAIPKSNPSNLICPNLYL